jgi:hypothetical protein
MLLIKKCRALGKPNPRLPQLFPKQHPLSLRTDQNPRLLGPVWGRPQNQLGRECGGLPEPAVRLFQSNT